MEEVTGLLVRVDHVGGMVLMSQKIINHLLSLYVFYLYESTGDMREGENEERRFLQEKCRIDVM